MRRKSKILVVTDSCDQSSDAVILRLRELGELPIRLNLATIPSEANFSVEDGDTENSGVLRTRNRDVDVAQIKTVYWRRPKRFVFPQKWTEQERNFGSAELDHALDGLWHSLDACWVDHPTHLRQARSRMRQFRSARELGFETPRTLITLQPDTVMPFLQRCGGRALLKVMGSPVLAPQGNDDIKQGPERERTLVPTMLTIDALQSVDCAMVASAPCFLQEYVPHERQVRVIIAGDTLFSVFVEGAPLRVRADWDTSNQDLSVSRADLPQEIQERCFALARKLNLTFCVIDLLTMGSARYFFLECNPEGDFLGVERRLPEIKIVDAICRLLMPSMAAVEQP
jgi:hypothetical protein